MAHLYAACAIPRASRAARRHETNTTAPAARTRCLRAPPPSNDVGVSEKATQVITNYR
jgi:hypothetical protein